MNTFKQLLEEYYSTQRELLELIVDKDTAWLEAKLPNRKYHFHFLVEGLIQHDIYHLGQISMLKKASES